MSSGFGPRRRAAVRRDASPTWRVHRNGDGPHWRAHSQPPFHQPDPPSLAFNGGTGWARTRRSCTTSQRADRGSSSIRQYGRSESTRSSIIIRARAPMRSGAAIRLPPGRFDLLGYKGLTFGNAGERERIDWHLDPVHRRRAPQAYWSRVPYLEPSCGDHKVVWELNRHQSWLMLGTGVLADG